MMRTSVQAASVAFVDPHPLCRLGLRTLLAREGGLSLLPDPHDARTLAGESPPDVAVIDVVADPGAVERVHQMWPDAEIVALVDGDGTAVDGAHAVSKRAPLSDLLGAIREAARRRGFAALTNADPLDVLSTREREVFGLILDGLSTEAIATRLAISAKTVETHRTNINRKLGARSAADLVRFAAARGLLG